MQSKNFIDYEEYPQTADIQAKCVNMVSMDRPIEAHDFVLTASRLPVSSSEIDPCQRLCICRSNSNSCPTDDKSDNAMGTSTVGSSEVSEQLVRVEEKS
jgi:hypothetical protein